MGKRFYWFWVGWVLAGTAIMLALFYTPPPLPYFPVEFMLNAAMVFWGITAVNLARVQVAYRTKFEVEGTRVRPGYPTMTTIRRKGFSENPAPEPRAARDAAKLAAAIYNRKQVDEWGLSQEPLEAWQVLPAAIKPCESPRSVDGLHVWQTDPDDPTLYYHHLHPFKGGFTIVYCDLCHKGMIQEHEPPKPPAPPDPDLDPEDGVMP